MFTKTQLFAAVTVAASASTVLAAPFYDTFDIEARGPGASKAKDTIAKAASSRAGRKVASEVGKNVYTKVAGDKLDEQKKKDASKKSEHHHSHGKRDLDAFLEALEARDFDEIEELYARGSGASKAAKDTIGKAASSRAGRKVASEVGKHVYTKVAGDKLDEQKKKDANKKSEHHHGHGKRDLDALLEALEARDFDEIEELYARGPGASKAAKDTIGKAASSRAGRKVASEVGKNVYTKVAGDKLDEQKKKDGAKKSESHHHSHGKRELEPELLELIGRELELYDDLD